MVTWLTGKGSNSAKGMDVCVGASAIWWLNVNRNLKFKVEKSKHDEVWKWTERLRYIFLVFCMFRLILLDKMGRTCSMYENMGNENTIVVEELKRRPFGWHRYERKDNIKMDLRQQRVKTGLNWLSNCRVQRRVRGCIQKFPDWVDNEINNNKHSMRSNTKGYGGKTH
jgi:hypothetical protein